MIKDKRKKHILREGICPKCLLLVCYKSLITPIDRNINKLLVTVITDEYVSSAAGIDTQCP